MTTPSFPRLFSPLTIGSSPRSGSRSRYGKAVTADRRPVIGLTTYAETARMLVWDREFALLHASYIAATERAGGVAVLLPPQSAGADEVLDRVDGLVLVGGADVDPARYGETAAERTSAPRVLRDEWEIALATAALLGPAVHVRCHHHQALARVAAGLTITARAADGTVEAVEVDRASFALAVQWHPEEDHADARLFAALAAAGRQHRAAPRPGDRRREAG